VRPLLALLLAVRGIEYYVAVDVGATKTRVALCTKSGIVDREVRSTPRSGGELAVAELIARIAAEKWSDKLGDVVAVGVATIGPLDIKRGRVVNTPNLPLRNFELLEPLVRFFGKPVLVANDAVAAAWGEAHYGDGRGYSNVVYVTLSTGVGCGVIVNGNLLIGKMGNAHEAGHIVVDFDSDLECGCGGRGHWEAYAGGANLPRVARRLAEKHRVDSELSRLVLSGASIEARDVFEYYRRGDSLARLVVDLYVKATAAGLASVINAYDPEVVIIGGSVFLNNVDVLLDPLVSLVEANIVTEMPVIKPTRLGDDVGLYGALALVVDPPRALLEAQRDVIVSTLGRPITL
jgi:glucokinase